MPKLPAWIFLTILFTAASGCSSSPSRPSGQIEYNSPQSSTVIKVARSMLGTPYKYGGVSPKTGFDCSGLVLYSYKQVGVQLPRTADDQFLATFPVAKKAIKRGDLLFFRINYRKISHVGIYLGNNTFIHAPSSGKKVSIARLDSPYWSKRFAKAGRIRFQ